VSASSRLEREYRLYRRRIARCRTENQINRVHIALGSYMTPFEVRYFDAALERDDPGSISRAWFTDFMRLMPLRQLRQAEFERRGVLKGLSIYSAQLGSPEQKTLLICFAGNFHRLGLPSSTLLDCLDPALYDVIILRDLSLRVFSWGIPGLGEDFFTTVAALRRYVDLSAYRNSITLGTSSGSLPALLAAILLETDRGIYINGTDLPQFAAYVKSFGVSDAPYAEALARRPEPFPDLLLVYSGQHAEDAGAAKALHERVPSRLLGVANCGTHGVLGWKLTKGRLPSFLSRLLGQKVESHQLAATAETE
jgi:hypothetical protein